MEILFQVRTAIDGSNPEINLWCADCVIVPAFRDEGLFDFSPALLEAAPWICGSPAARDFKAKKNEICFVYGLPEQPIARVVFVGLGKRADFKPIAMRDAVAVAVKACAGLKLERIGVAAEVFGLAEKHGVRRERLVEEAVLGAQLGLYSFEQFRSKFEEDEAGFIPRSMSFLFAEKVVPESVRVASRKAGAIAAGIRLARDLANAPANVMTPSRLEEEAQKLARTYNFNCASFGPDFIQSEGMGAFWAVARGSAQEPRLIILEHVPAGAENDAPFVIAGKGITFDSGGISLKPADAMFRMKSDMSGAATVLGIFAALGCSGENLAKRRVIGIVPCAENMPGGNATRPGDVVTTLSGRTVEISNTDAEGRLLLCECLTLAQKRWKPAALVDIATLTGACVVALGHKTSGLYSTDDELCARILGLGKDLSERLWHMPIWDEDIEELKSAAADLSNIGPREGAANFAALFLRQFIEADTPWAHLDVAGTAFTSVKTPTCPGGATGACLRLLYELATR